MEHILQLYPTSLAVFAAIIFQILIAQMLIAPFKLFKS